MNAAEGDRFVGAWLRALRRGFSLRSLAAVTESSRSELSRIARGDKRPSPELAARLDEHFNQSGALRAALLRLSEDAQPSTRATWVHHYPAPYSGPVWMLLVDSTPDTCYSLRWGPWQRQGTTEGTGTVALTFHKGDDGLSVSLIVTVQPPTDIRFGIGTPMLATRAIDVDDGWVHDPSP